MSDFRHDARAAREEVRSGRLRGAALMDRLLTVPYAERDGWVDELLGLPELPEDSELPRGSVPYLPASVEDIVAALREGPVRADDVFVDIGAGVGRVALLAHLLSGARAHGIEIQPRLVESAVRCRDALGLTEVSFEVGDATNAALDGSVFFLYAPFNGEQLRRVSRRLSELARVRHIVVCAVGVELPADRELLRRGSSTAALTFFESRG